MTLYRTAAARRAAPRLRGEYREMPGMRLTLDQAMRLWDIDRQTCSQRARLPHRDALPRNWMAAAGTGRTHSRVMRLLISRKGGCPCAGFDTLSCNRGGLGYCRLRNHERQLAHRAQRKLRRVRRPTTGVRRTTSRSAIRGSTTTRSSTTTSKAPSKRRMAAKGFDRAVDRTTRIC